MHWSLELPVAKCAAAMIALSALADGSALAAQQPVAAFRVARDSFSVRFEGAPEGYAIHEYTRTSSGYRYVNQIRIGALLLLQFDVQLNRLLQPLAVASQTQMGAQSGASDVRYHGQRARGTARSINGGDRRAVSIDTVLPAGAFDGHALYPVLLSRPWSVGRTERLTVFDTDERSVTVQTARAIREELIDAGGRKQTALRIELSTTQLPVTLWVSARAPFRLLRVTSANGTTTLERSSDT